MKKQTIDKMFEKLPVYVVADWCIYKGKTYFSMINVERSIEAKKPMVDLSYCATRAMNNIVIKTVQYDKKKFKEKIWQ